MRKLVSKESFITSRSENESLPLVFLALFFKQKRKEKKKQGLKHCKFVNYSDYQ